MVYKRYIRKNGKICGPYYYESYRDKNGKVISRYLKNYKPKAYLKKELIVFAAILVIFAFGLFYLRSPSGNAILRINNDFQTNYSVGESINGTVSLEISNEILYSNLTLNLSLTKDNLITVNKEVLASDFLNMISPVSETVSVCSNISGEDMDICENITLSSIVENCTSSEVFNEELNQTETATTCENITVSSIVENCTIVPGNISESCIDSSLSYYNQIGIYSRNISDFLQYRFNSAGNYKFVFSVDSSSEERTINVRESERQIGILSTPGNISGCQAINVSGEYIMIASIPNANVSCMNISVSDVSLDCNGFYILKGSLSSPGIYAKNANNITIKNCNSTMGTLTSGSGIYFNNVSNSLIYNFTTYSSYGINLLDCNNITISSSNINGSKKYGILLNSTQNSIVIDVNSTNVNQTGIGLFNSNSNNVSNSNFSGITNTITNSTGIYLYNSSYNYIGDSFADNKYYAGILIRNSSYNNLVNCSASNGYNYGTIIDSPLSAYNNLTNFSSNSNLKCNYFISDEANNNLVYNSQAYNSSYGDFCLFGAYNNTFRNISSLNSGSAIRLDSSSNNYFIDSMFNGSQNNSIEISSGSISGSGITYYDYNNSFENIAVTNTNSSFFDMNLSGANLTRLINTNIRSYYFSQIYGFFSENSFGNLIFNNYLNGSSSNLSNDIKILNNSAYVNSSVNGLNVSANITLYNMPLTKGYVNQTILRDGAACNETTTPACYNLTSLRSNLIFNFSFKVDSWSNYSFYSGDYVAPPVINLTSPQNNSNFTGSSYNVSFIFNVSSSVEMINCSVVANGNYYINSSPVNSTGNLIIVNLSNGSYNSHVNCADIAENSANSSSSLFIINYSCVASGCNGRCGSVDDGCGANIDCGACGGGSSGGGGSGGSTGNKNISKQNSSLPKNLSKSSEPEMPIADNSTEKKGHFDFGKSCNPVWSCGEWGECSPVYNLNNLIAKEIILKGERSRTCIDNTRCMYDLIEREECEDKIPIIIKKGSGCFEGFIEVYNTNNTLISILNLRDSGINSLDIRFVFDSDVYCPSCYNRILDNDETGVDCGGSCGSCLKYENNFSLRFPWEYLSIVIFSALVLIILIFSIIKIRHLLGMKRLKTA